MTRRVCIVPMVVCALHGCASSAAQNDAANNAAASRQRTASAAARLAALPDGEERRRFILDCTGCHTFHEGIAYPGGVPRTVESWTTTTASMVARFGPASGFPVIGPNRDPEATARWLAQSLPAQPPAAVPLPRSITGRADIREYVLPEPTDLPHDIAVHNGRVLITGMFTARLYHLDPETGVVATEPTPAPNPRAIEVDASGNLWVVLGGPQLVARKAPNGEWRTYNAGFYAHSVALGNDGGVWVNGHFTHDPEVIRRIEPESGTHRDFIVPKHPDFTTTPVPYEIRVAPDGAVWMSELIGNRIVRLNPASGETKIWTMPTTVSGPRRLDIDPAGVVWIPEYSANKLARFDPRTETFAEYPLPVETAGPYIARYDTRRNLVWIGTSAADVLFSFNPRTSVFRAYPLPSTDQLVRHMAIDGATGDIWLAPGASPGITGARVVRFRPLN